MSIPFLDLKRLNAPFFSQIKDAADRVIASGRYIGGEECMRFEQALGRYVGAPCVAGVSNGLDALRLILRAWVERGDMRRGDEVIVAANTYIASVLAVIDAGLTPVLAPVDMATLNLDTKRLEESLSPRTRAIMPVHLYGRACWDNALVEFVNHCNLLVIEDNAQAIGAQATADGLPPTDGKGHQASSRFTGALGHAGAFSFYPTKNLGALGDAGAVATHDADLARRVRALANYGSDKRYHNIHLGYNCRLDPLQAAVLNVKLPHLGAENAHRRALAAIYDEAIANPRITKPMQGGADMVWHQYVIQCNDRDTLQAYLAQHGIATDIHYATPPHRQPCLIENEGLCRVAGDAARQAEKIGATVLSLPISSCTSTDDAEMIADVINRF